VSFAVWCGEAPLSRDPRKARHGPSYPLTGPVPIAPALMNTVNRLNVIAQQPAGDYQAGRFE
jgi:hypothetical protein